LFAHKHFCLLYVIYTIIFYVNIRDKAYAKDNIKMNAPIIKTDASKKFKGTSAEKINNQKTIQISAKTFLQD